MIAPVIAVRFAIVASVLAVAGAAAAAGPVFQPPGANVTFGNVTHGHRMQALSSNAAAAWQAGSEPMRGAALSLSAGLEYGNVENLFDFYDRLTAGYEPSDPGTGGGPGQDPGDKPDGGIDLGEIWDRIDPDVQAAVAAIAEELTVQTALAALIREEGYGKAWLSADVPLAFGSELFGGRWTLGINWSGAAKSFGIVDTISFDTASALARLEDWLAEQAADRPTSLLLSDDVRLLYDAAANSVELSIRNDSSIVSKATQTTELDFAWSRPAWLGETGGLYVGGRLRAYFMRLSRLSVRWGDITDSEELFDEIRDAEFTNDTGVGLDLGALWISDNYQLGAQIDNVNEPEFEFPAVDLAPYTSDAIIEFLARDRRYTMDRQLHFEASAFTDDRRWSAHVGIDADSATDPLGDDYRWLTISGAWTPDSRWAPGLRLGYRENLAGPGFRYASGGLTLFRIVNLDVAAALDTVRIDGEKLPQGLMVSLGFEITW